MGRIDQVENAEKMSACYEEAITNIKNAIDALLGVDNADASVYADELSDMLKYLCADKAEYDETIEEDNRLMQKRMLAQYWRDVV